MAEDLAQRPSCQNLRKDIGRGTQSSWGFREKVRAQDTSSRVIICAERQWACLMCKDRRMSPVPALVLSEPAWRGGHSTRLENRLQPWKFPHQHLDLKHSPERCCQWVGRAEYRHSVYRNGILCGKCHNLIMVKSENDSHSVVNTLWPWIKHFASPLSSWILQ